MNVFLSLFHQRIELLTQMPDLSTHFRWESPFAIKNPLNETPFNLFSLCLLSVSWTPRVFVSLMTIKLELVYCASDKVHVPPPVTSKPWRISLCLPGIVEGESHPPALTRHQGYSLNEMLVCCLRFWGVQLPILHPVPSSLCSHTSGSLC